MLLRLQEIHIAFNSSMFELIVSKCPYLFINAISSSIMTHLIKNIFTQHHFQHHNMYHKFLIIVLKLLRYTAALNILFIL